ncbi:NADH-dependent flavin oxidoreductase/NADH oxidase [Colletotrichum tofieldiae]|nr:NADH-dependent flavin oxidoreductase/NADH oxidase [Colletotrichum tofieldiae]GKT71490.1 NADH-dependent flavin oxidoreductase/NADH oxidase [Colletotrichum tofieldiae]
MSTTHHNIQEKPDTPDHYVNEPAPGIPYFTPKQDPPAGTALLPEGQKDVPKLFRPLKLRGLVLQNRIALSPLCQYSAQDGHYTMWHETHMGGIIQRGPGIASVEATAVQPRGRITPEDVGLWKDSQIEPLRKVVEFAHSQNQKIMIQLAHAGRKASTVAPWLSSGSVAGKDLNGWPDDVHAPSAIAWNEHHAHPKEMSTQDVEQFKAAFADSVEETRAIIPKDMPLFLRISATDWLEEQNDIPESWTADDTVKLAPLLAERGVDLLDVSTGGNHERQHPHVGPAYQAPFAIKVKQAVGNKMAVGAVGSINNAKLANELLEKDGLDVVFVGRGFQKNPGLVFSWADELGVQINMPNQIRWGFGGRGKKSGKPATEIPELIGKP